MKAFTLWIPFFMYYQKYGTVAVYFDSTLCCVFTHESMGDIHGPFRMCFEGKNYRII